MQHCWINEKILRTWGGRGGKRRSCHNQSWYVNRCSTVEPIKNYVWVMISNIGFFTSSPSLVPLYHHYKLTPVSTSTYGFPHHIAIHSSNSITSSSPLIEAHNAKQSASLPPPTHVCTADPLLPPQSSPSVHSTLNSAVPRLSFDTTLRTLLHPISTHLVLHWLLT